MDIQKTVTATRADDPACVRAAVIEHLRQAGNMTDVRVFAFETCDLPSVKAIARYALDYGITVVFGDERAA